MAGKRGAPVGNHNAQGHGGRARAALGHLDRISTKVGGQINNYVKKNPGRSTMMVAIAGGASAPMAVGLTALVKGGLAARKQIKEHPSRLVKAFSRKGK